MALGRRVDRLEKLAPPPADPAEPTFAQMEAAWAALPAEDAEHTRLYYAYHCRAAAFHGGNCALSLETFIRFATAKELQRLDELWDLMLANIPPERDAEEIAASRRKQWESPYIFYDRSEQDELFQLWHSVLGRAGADPTEADYDAFLNAATAEERERVNEIHRIAAARSEENWKRTQPDFPRVSLPR
ncbi:MAG TPA: hypothetical protein VKD90_17600 [Gemmataceae bacterium]|nr:hypothetical protein [Gemmataceae bacterium]